MAGEGRGPIRVEKHHHLGFLIFLAILDLIVIGLASYHIDQVLNGNFDGSNSASTVFATVTLVAALLLVAAIVSGIIHFHHYNSGSVGGATTAALIAWVLILLAFGLACKEIDLGNTGRTEKALEAFVFILAFFETIYVLLIHAGLFNSKFGVGY